MSPSQLHLSSYSLLKYVCLVEKHQLRIRPPRRLKAMIQLKYCWKCRFTRTRKAITFNMSCLNILLFHIQCANRIGENNHAVMFFHFEESVFFSFKSLNLSTWYLELLGHIVPFCSSAWYFLFSPFFHLQKTQSNLFIKQESLNI